MVLPRLFDFFHIFLISFQPLQTRVYVCDDGNSKLFIRNVTKCSHFHKRYVLRYFIASPFVSCDELEK